MIRLVHVEQPETTNTRITHHRFLSFLSVSLPFVLFQACCSGYCNTEHTRCDDNVPNTPSDDQNGGGQRNNDGPYDDGPHNDGRHDDGQYDDDGIITDDTAGDPALASPAPAAADPISDPNPADSPGTDDDDFDGPPMKIDPDGPYAHGRSYSNYDDDYYHGYSRGAGYGVEPGAAQPPTTQNPQDDDEQGSHGAPPLPPDNDNSPPTGVDEDDDNVPSCAPDYSSGTIETIAFSSEERIEVVTMDSQVTLHIANVRVPYYYLVWYFDVFGREAKVGETR